MTSGSSSTIFFSGLRDQENDNKEIKEQDFITESAPAQRAAPLKRKRNQPGNPNPDAEVIALSPKTLMATNRFVCEVCNKGFQREQNLQLHRRGHNLPWKLKQKTSKEVKRKVYLCPEPTCIHHDPSRALGDLTGIKKHFSRKHGEKKYKCQKCSKKYAVQSDCKAHSKTCGNREYRCDCGTFFSRRDSFITHKGFCEALAQENARDAPTMTNIYAIDQDRKPILSDILGLGNSSITQFSNLFGQSTSPTFRPPSHNTFFMPNDQQHQALLEENQSDFVPFPTKQFFKIYDDIQNNNNPNPQFPPDNFFNLGLLSNTSGINASSNNDMFPSSDDQNNIGTTSVNSLYSTSMHPHNLIGSQMSATALLQKAAQLGPTSSNSSLSLLRSFGSTSSSSGTKFENNFGELMNSSSIFGGNYGGYNGKKILGVNEEAANGVISFGELLRGGGVNGGSRGENLTRDFLGVGDQMLRRINSMDSESKNAEILSTSSHGFGGGIEFSLREQLK